MKWLRFFIGRIFEPQNRFPLLLKML